MPKKCCSFTKKKGVLLVSNAMKKPCEADQIATRKVKTAKIREERLLLPIKITRSKLVIKTAVNQRKIE